jgi:hypothetical protein
MSDEDEAEIERYNRRELWRDVANHLTVAREAVEQAQGSLEDLAELVLVEALQPIHDALRRAANDADEEAAPGR